MKLIKLPRTKPLWLVSKLEKDCYDITIQFHWINHSVGTCDNNSFNYAHKSYYSSVATRNFEYELRVQ